MRDMASKGRCKKQFGESNKSSKLSDSLVIQIRREFPNKSIRCLSSQYRVHDDTIRRIVNGTRWKHLLTTDSATGEENA